MPASSISAGMRCAGSTRALVHKLDTFTDQHRAAQQRLRHLIWWFYSDLKALLPRSDTTAQGRLARPLLIASSNAAPALPPSTACSLGCTPTSRNC